MLSSEHYWDERYGACGTMNSDWYQDYKSLKKYTDRFVNENCNILDLGCGNSTLAYDLRKHHKMKNPTIVSIDFSCVVINQMQDLYWDEKGIIYLNMDATKLNHDLLRSYCNSFDLIFDKGLFDSINVGLESSKNIEQLLQGVYKILRKGGVYIMITHAPVENRISDIEFVGLDWIKIDHHAIPSKQRVGESDTVIIALK